MEEIDRIETYFNYMVDRISNGDVGIISKIDLPIYKRRLQDIRKIKQLYYQMKKGR